MYGKKIDVLTKIIMVLIILFVVFSAFDGVEIWYRFWDLPQNDLVAGELIKTGAIDKFFPVALIVGTMEMVLLFIKMQKMCFLSLFCAIAGFIFSLRVPFYAVVVKDGIMGGLGSTEYIATTYGYLLVACATVILVLQILLYKFKKNNLASRGQQLC